jgi:hypothetical protein
MKFKITISFILLAGLQLVNAQSPGGVTGATFWWKGDGVFTLTGNEQTSIVNLKTPAVTLTKQGATNSYPTIHQGGRTSGSRKFNYHPFLHFAADAVMGFEPTGSGDQLNLGNYNTGMTVFMVHGPAGSPTDYTVSQSNPSNVSAYWRHTSNGRFKTKGDGIYAFTNSGGGSSTNNQIADQFAITTKASIVSFGGNTAGSFNTGRRDGADKTLSSNTISSSTIQGGFYLGGNDGWGEKYNGTLAEIVVFNSNLDPTTDYPKVESYLALKYGITLDQSISSTYVNSSGTVIWNPSDNSGYTSNIFGLGRDDGSGLRQLQSKSLNTEALVTLSKTAFNANGNNGSTQSFAANNSFLMVSDNNAAATWTTTGAPAGRKILQRKFKVTETGADVTDYQIIIPGSTNTQQISTTKIPQADPDGVGARTVYLLQDADGDFSAGAISTTMTRNGGGGTSEEYQLNNVDLDNGQYFTFACTAPAPTVLEQIGTEADNPDVVNSVVTTTQLSSIAGVTGVVAANQTAYQDYIDANPDSFANPATATEVQAMITAVNASQTVLTQIGTQADDLGVAANLTLTQLQSITPALTGTASPTFTIAAFNAYVDANAGLFGAPATQPQVQAAINAINASATVLQQIGNEGDTGNTVPSVVTTTQLGTIVPAVTGIVPANQAAYQAFIDANPDSFTAVATQPEVQAMITAVNASQTVLAQVGAEGDTGNTVPSAVTTTQLAQISPAVTGIVAANQAAYQAFIDANPDSFTAVATQPQVQAMVTAVNAAQASNTVLAQVGSEGDTGNTVPSVVTTTQLGTIVPAVTGIVPANQAAYQAFIDANPDSFTAVATQPEVQAMVNAVNASQTVLAQVGAEGDTGNTVPSAVTTAQLEVIVPAVTGIVAANQAAYQAFIDANPDSFTAVATQAEVQAMVTAVNLALSSDSFDVTSFKMYPNPVSNVLTISNLEEIQNVTIYDITGKEMMNSNLNVFESQLDLSSFSNGLYLVKVSVNNNTKTFRVVKN